MSSQSGGLMVSAHVPSRQRQQAERADPPGHRNGAGRRNLCGKGVSIVVIDEFSQERLSAKSSFMRFCYGEFRNHAQGAVFTSSRRSTHKANGGNRQVRCTRRTARSRRRAADVARRGSTRRSSCTAGGRAEVFSAVQRGLAGMTVSALRRRASRRRCRAGPRRADS